MWLLTSGGSDYLIIRFRIRMPEIRDRISMLIIMLIIPVTGSRASDIPIPAIMVSETNNSKRAATAGKATPSASRKRPAEKLLCENVAVKC